MNELRRPSFLKLYDHIIHSRSINPIDPLTIQHFPTALQLFDNPGM